MYRCNNCGAEFEQPRMMVESHGEKLGHCPNCLDIDYTDIETLHCDACEDGYVEYKGERWCADFFKRTDLKEHDAIISNPPFSKREAILETLFKHHVPFGIILNMNGLFDSKARWKLFKDNEFELLIPSGRMKFYNENCKGNSPNFQSVYVCQGIIGKQIEFAELYQDRQIKMFNDN